jgi:flagellar hook-associated protein 2
MSSSSINLISSAIDVTSIVDNLIYVDSAPVRQMQSQTTTLQSKVSAFQTLNTKLSALSNKVNTLLFGSTSAPLLNPYLYYDRLADSTFAQCKVTSSDDSLISAKASNATDGGDYSITVSNLAQARTLASANFADTTATKTGTGTITITSGSNDPVTITVNESNNTLTGIYSAINAANAGVTATIINDGTSSPYRLLIKAKDTGTANSFTVSDNLSGGQALNLTEKQAAADAQFIINGVGITKSSNTISDVINGVTFTLKSKTASAVTLHIEKDIDSIVTALKEFASAYNDINTFIKNQFAYNASTKSAGLLSGDSTLRRIQDELQRQVTQTVSNRYTSYYVANRVGLEFNRDGTLSIDEAQLRSALSEDFTGVAALFLGDGTPSGSVSVTDSRVTYSARTEATQAGTYSLEISGLAQKAVALGGQQVTTLAADEQLRIDSGTGSAVVNLLQDDSLATILLKINNELSAQGMGITATDDGTGKIKISSNSFGSDQTFTVISDKDGGSGTTGFGSTPVAAAGTDITGTINGHAATGNGLRLSGGIGQPEDGLSVNIAQTQTGSYGSITIASVAQGVEGSSILMNLQSILHGITDPLSGPIHNSTDALNQSINALNKQITAYQSRLEVRKALLTAEFQKADEALRLLSVTQSSLSSQIAKLG